MCKDHLHQNNTYKAIRLFGSSFNLYYSIWCNNEYELYDMSVRVSQIRKVVVVTDEFSYRRLIQDNLTTY
jgi:hypothetical protein